MLGWDPSGQWLATAGYAVFLPNPRGGKGHGHDFAVRLAGAVGLDEWTDICAGIDLLIAGGVADPETGRQAAAAVDPVADRRRSSTAATHSSRHVRTPATGAEVTFGDERFAADVRT